MIEEPALVIENHGDFAHVETQRKTSCGSCSAESTCGTSVLAKFFGKKRSVLSVKNSIGAQPGEQVVIGLAEASLPKASFLLYIAPLLSLLLFAFIGEWLAGYFAITFKEPVTIICGLLGLLVGLKGIGVYTRRFNTNESYHAVILRRSSTKSVNLITR